MNQKVESRWDPFTLGELAALAEAMEAAYFSVGEVDEPLWRDLLDTMDARGAGTDRLRDDIRWSAEEAREQRDEGVVLGTGREAAGRST